MCKAPEFPILTGIDPVIDNISEGMRDYKTTGKGMLVDSISPAGKCSNMLYSVF